MIPVAQYSSVILSASSFVAVVSILPACGQQSVMLKLTDSEITSGPLTFVTADSTGKIIGESDLIPVLNDGENIPERYSRLIDAFGIMSMGCTATHIGDGFALTAGHCFLATAQPQRSSMSCEGVSVSWGFRKDKAPYLISRCVKVFAAEWNDNRDYAIFEVDKAPSQKIGFDLQTRPKEGTVLTIFGHPQQRPLEWSRTCVLEKAARGGWGSDQFSHQCDTEQGNSGSAVLDDTALKIVAIHDGGRVPWNYATYLIDTPLAEFFGGNTEHYRPDSIATLTNAGFNRTFGAILNRDLH